MKYNSRNDLPKDVEIYGEALIRAWEQYLKIIDILIALAGATALVLVNLFKGLGASNISSPLGMVAVSSFGLALFSLAFWRFSAQHFFEYETIGSRRISQRYYHYHGISHPTTKAHVNQDKVRPFIRIAYKFFAIASGILLAVSWLSFLLMIAKSGLIA